MAREGIVDHAVRQGYCEDHDFDFTKCFSSGIYQEPTTRYTREGCGRYLLKTNYGEISPLIMMEILRDHSAGICMHGGFRTTASQVSLLSKETSIHWFTGSPHPCTSFFKPFIVPYHDDSRVIDIWKQREQFTSTTREDVIQKLNSLEQELIKEIADLFAKFDYVKDYYETKIHPKSTEPVLKKYKKTIKDEFFPSRGFGKLRASVVKKAISDYKKVSGDPHGLANLMLYYVEMGTKFIHSYGDIKEVFYDSMENTYEKTLELIFKHKMQDEFQDRCYKVVERSKGTGYGFYDTLSILYQQYYES